jgi:hypothetical protein
MDGRLDDEIWAKATFTDGFIQKQPTEGKSPEHWTEVAFVYDDEAFYVGARMHSTDPNNILSTVSRRDNTGTSEKILVSLDTYLDGRTAYTFGVTASGVRVDYYHPSDHEYNRDHSYDPVWEARVARTGDGWSAEMRIPFTQMRFANKDVQTWGLNMNRWVPTDNEDSYWVLVPKDENGWSSRMGEIVGISGLKPSKRIELMPYVVSDARFQAGIDDADPFRDSQEFKGRVGGDFKMGVGPNLTLQGTINPDFGQVEADPAEVNLSPFESVFSERRPFFTENRQKLEGGNANYFYSRRIGRKPSGWPDDDKYEYINRPEFASILGAAKLTGRLNSGLSVGALAAVTEKEKAEVFDMDTNTGGEEVVEPLTGYGVIRLQQEFGKDASTVGMILTGTQRNLTDESDLDTFLRSRAITGGSDWNLRFDGGKYEIGGNLGFSHIEGTTDAITAAQESSARYFQRPAASHTELDTTRTSMSGFRTGLWAEKNSGKHWLGGFGFGAESPEFELNDIGQIGTSDDVESWAWLRYRETEPGKWFQDWWANAHYGTGYNFERDRQYRFIDLEAAVTYKNFWGSFVSLEGFQASQSDNLTRGGPSMGTSDRWNAQVELWSSGKSKTTWNLWTGGEQSEIGGWGYWTGGGVTVRPGTRWQLSISPNWTHFHNARQFIDAVDWAGGGQSTYGTRYVFSSVEQTRLRATTRLNFSFTPDLSLEYYAEPFANSVRYSNFGELSAARSKDIRHYGKAGGTSIVESSDGVYDVTDGADSFTLEVSDFQSLSFRSNLVLRWEWSPGSTVFLVWQMNRSDSPEVGNNVRPSNLLDAFRADGDNFLALKVTYWIPFM